MMGNKKKYWNAARDVIVDVTIWNVSRVPDLRI